MQAQPGRNALEIENMPPLPIARQPDDERERIVHEGGPADRTLHPAPQTFPRHPFQAVEEVLVHAGPHTSLAGRGGMLGFADEERDHVVEGGGGGAVVLGGGAGLARGSVAFGQEPVQRRDVGGHRRGVRVLRRRRRRVGEVREEGGEIGAARWRVRAAGGDCVGAGGGHGVFDCVCGGG